MLGERVAVYLDDGPSVMGLASTIIDATGLVGPEDERRPVRVLRDGAISRAELRTVLGDLLEREPDTAPKPAPAPAPNPETNTGTGTETNPETNPHPEDPEA